MQINTSISAETYR